MFTLYACEVTLPVVEMCNLKLGLAVPIPKLVPLKVKLALSCNTPDVPA